MVSSQLSSWLTNKGKFSHDKCNISLNIYDPNQMFIYFQIDVLISYEFI